MLTQIKFGDLAPGAKFYIDDLEHVKLQKNSGNGNWNACDIETGTLCYVVDQITVSICKATASAHEQLIALGCTYVKAEDRFGDTRTGYWFQGDDPTHRVYGDFLGETEEAAMQAIKG